MSRSSRQTVFGIILGHWVSSQVNRPFPEVLKILMLTANVHQHASQRNRTNIRSRYLREVQWGERSEHLSAAVTLP